MTDLATTVISKLRGHEEIGLGTVLGGNIFNGLLLLALYAAHLVAIVETSGT